MFSSPLPSPLYNAHRSQALYSEASMRLDHLDSFLASLRDHISPLLRQGLNPPREMVDAVAAAKVGGMAAKAWDMALGFILTDW